MHGHGLRRAPSSRLLHDLPRYVIFDGAHNPQAVSGLNEAIELFLARHAKVSSVVAFSTPTTRTSGRSAAAVVFSPVDVPHQPRSTPSAALRAVPQK
ncbi:hypothetical protein DIPPA_11649 [Diplonema papillatum]|nr:hypothetical protein DIPPA_11649 [Diplonema papillatum]